MQGTGRERQGVRVTRSRSRDRKMASEGFVPVPVPQPANAKGRGVSQDIEVMSQQVQAGFKRFGRKYAALKRQWSFLESKESQESHECSAKDEEIIPLCPSTSLNKDICRKSGETSQDSDVQRVKRFFEQIDQKYPLCESGPESIVSQRQKLQTGRGECRIIKNTIIQAAQEDCILAEIRDESDSQSNGKDEESKDEEQEGKEEESLEIIQLGVNLEEHENQQEQSNSEDGQDEVLSLVKGHLENTLDVVSARDSPVLKGELQFLWKLGSHYVWNNFPQALQNSLKTYVTHLSPSDQAFYSHNDIQLLEDLTSLQSQELAYQIHQLFFSILVTKMNTFNQARKEVMEKLSRKTSGRKKIPVRPNFRGQRQLSSQNLSLLDCVKIEKGYFEERRRGTGLKRALVIKDQIVSQGKGGHPPVINIYVQEAGEMNWMKDMSVQKAEREKRRLERWIAKHREVVKIEISDDDM